MRLGTGTETELDTFACRKVLFFDDPQDQCQVAVPMIPRIVTGRRLGDKEVEEYRRPIRTVTLWVDSLNLQVVGLYHQHRVGK